MNDDDFDAAVGMTRKWDARQAGREVARNTIRKLKRPPDFFLLFSTIHYEKNGGFQEFLDGVWDVLPPDTPLIGGTVAGFINPDGCYTRGASALAVSYPRMDVSTGLGHSTKRFPGLAANKCANMLFRELNNSNYKTGFIFDMLSSGLVPQIPGTGRRRIFKGFIGKLASALYPLFSIIQKGSGKEDEVWNTFIKSLNLYNVLSCSSMDDMKMLENYQFYKDKIMKNSIVGLGLKTDLKCLTNTTHGMKKTSITFNVTKTSSDKRLIKKIDGKPATKEFIKTMGWPEDYLDESIYRRVFYYPIGFEEKNHLVPEIIGSFVGDSFLVSWKLKKTKLSLLTISGKGLIESVEDNLKKFKDKNPKLGLMCSCGARLETLGSNVYHVREKLLDFFEDTPFLLLYVGGESTHAEYGDIEYGNDTMNTIIFSN